MPRYANYRVLAQDKASVLIQDIGPWDQFLSVTNDVEHVVKVLAASLAGRDLFYLDSDREQAQILIKDGKFAGFKIGDAHDPPS